MVSRARDATFRSWISSCIRKVVYHRSTNEYSISSDFASPDDQSPSIRLRSVPQSQADDFSSCSDVPGGVVTEVNITDCVYETVSGTS
jgi:hypothetical protein